MKKILVSLFCLALAYGFLGADVYIKSQMHNDEISFMGQTQPASDTTVHQWFAKDKMAQVTDKLSSIVDMVKKSITIVMHADKSYITTSYPLDLSKLVDPQFAPYLGMMKMAIKVTPTGQTKKIEKWNCTEYEMEISVAMMSIKSKVWATTDVPFDWTLSQELELNSMMRIVDEQSIKEMKKIKGVQILSETTMNLGGQEVKSNSKVLEITTKNAPANVFAVPAGYTKKETLDMTKLQ